MRSAAFVVPGALSSRTGGYIYDSHVIDGLRVRGWSVAVYELADDFPDPSFATLQQTSSVIAAIPDATLTLVDGLCYGAMPAVVEDHATRLAFVPIVHLPLAADPSLTAGAAAALRESEVRAMSCARFVIATGSPTVEMLQTYGVCRKRILLAIPGTAPAPLATGSAQDEPLSLLCAGTLNPIKGHDVLLQALASASGRPTLRLPPWRLICAGSLERHAHTASAVRTLTAQLGLQEHVMFTGELDADAMESAYDRSDVFVLATRRETYGMAVAEALAHGLPVVSTRTGAIPQLVGNDAGILVEPDDVESLSHALTRVIQDDSLRTRLRAGALRARNHLPTWDQTVQIIETGLGSLELGQTP